MSSPEREGRGGTPGRGRRLLGAFVYWLAVTLISLCLVVALILFLESRDESEVDGGAGAGPLPGSVA